MEGCMSIMCPHQQLDFLDEMDLQSTAVTSPPNSNKHGIIDRSFATRSYHVPSPFSVSRAVQPVDNIFSASYRDFNASCQPRCVEVSSYEQSLSTSSSHFLRAFDFEQLRVLDEFGLPCAASATWRTNYQPQNESPETGAVTGCILPTGFPTRFSDNTSGCYEDSGFNTTAIGPPTTAKDNVDVCRDIVDDLKNISSCSQAPGSDLGVVCTSELQAPDCGHATYGAVRTCSRDHYHREKKNGFYTSPSQMWSCIRFDDKSDPMMSSQTARCVDFSENATLPVKSVSTWFPNRSCLAPTVSQQVHLSINDAQELQPIALTTIGKFAAQTVSNCRQNYRQQNGTRCDSPQLSFDDRIHGNHATIPFMSLDSGDFSRHFVPTSLRTGKTWSRHRAVLTPEFSEMTRIGSGSEISAFFATASPRQFVSSEEAEKVRRTCRRRLFDDVDCSSRADGRDYTVHEKSQEPRDEFRTTPPPTVATSFYNDRRVMTPIAGLHSSGDPTPPMHVKGTCSERHSGTMTRATNDHEKRSSSANFNSRQFFSPALRQSDDPSCYRVADDGYTVRRKKSAAGAHRCHICDRSYTRPSSLRDHVTAQHSTTPRPHVCTTCHRRFTQPSNLVAHRRIHTGERPFACPITACLRRFTQSSSLATHMRTHSGLRPYVCGRCGRAFADSSTLTKHVRVHTGARPYRCDACPAAFSQSGNLRRHRRTHLAVVLSGTLSTAT